MPDWIAQLYPSPTEIAAAVPVVPFTDDGGIASPLYALPPQHTTAEVAAWIAQL